MEQNIVIDVLQSISVEAQAVEIVERKGIGHPDTICDACCEVASQALSKYYLKHFNTVLHHNVDKGLLTGGYSQPAFSGGKILEPIKLIIAGRVTDRVGDKSIPVHEIVMNSIKEYLHNTLELEPEVLEHFDIQTDFRQGAANLHEVFKREEMLANDTSFGVGHAPFSKTETVALELADFINSREFCKKHGIGKDIKVMARRQKNTLTIICAIPFIDKHIESVQEYFEKKAKLKAEILDAIEKMALGFDDVDVLVNTLDNENAQAEHEIYLTVSGLSAEHGDDGQVGRGNRASGLITPSRAMTLEATAGKNIMHTGKLYQVMAQEIANKIIALSAFTESFTECTIKILSAIGKPINMPQVISIELLKKNPNAIHSIDTEIEIKNIVNNEFSHVLDIQHNIIEGKYRLY